MTSIENHDPSEPTDSQVQAQAVEAGFLRRLESEVACWRGANLISGEQARVILSLYVAEAEVPAARGRLITALGILGSILIGVGVILFFAANWDGMAREAKIALVLVATLTAYGAGYWLLYLKDYVGVGTAVILLGTLLYGAAIHLIAQAYHFPVDDPNLVLIWFVGVVPLAYATRSVPIMALSLILLLAALGFRLQDWVFQDFVSDDRDIEVAVIAGGAIFGVVGLMLNGLGRLQALWGETRRYANSFQVIGLVTALGAIYLLGFRDLHQNESFFQDVRSLDHISTSYWVGMSVAGALVLAGSAQAAREIARNGLADVAKTLEAFGPLALVVPLVLVVALPASGEVAYPLTFNLVLLGAIVALLAAGYSSGREAFVNVGLVFFSVDVITRYFEFGWGLIDRSLVFVIAGAILLIGGYLLERGRRQVLERMREERGLA